MGFRPEGVCSSALLFDRGERHTIFQVEQGEVVHLQVTCGVRAVLALQWPWCAFGAVRVALAAGRIQPARFAVDDYVGMMRAASPLRERLLRTRDRVKSSD